MKLEYCKVRNNNTDGVAFQASDLLASCVLWQALKKLVYTLENFSMKLTCFIVGSDIRLPCSRAAVYSS
jgi:hypothetical protein